MNLQDIHDLYEYNFWANNRLMDQAEQVTQEQFVASSSHSFGSLQRTLIHTLDAELAWRLLLMGRPFKMELTTADLPTAAALHQRWREEELAMWQYIGGLSDKDLNGIIRYPVEGGVIRERVLWHCLFHVVNHGMQHRSEAAALLSAYGHSPGDIDFTVFLNERNARPR